MSDHACPACGYIHPDMDDRDEEPWTDLFEYENVTDERSLVRRLLDRRH